MGVWMLLEKLPRLRETALTGETVNLKKIIIIIVARNILIWMKMDIASYIVTLANTFN